MERRNCSVDTDLSEGMKAQQAVGIRWELLPWPSNVREESRNRYVRVQSNCDTSLRSSSRYPAPDHRIVIPWVLATSLPLRRTVPKTMEVGYGQSSMVQKDCPVPRR